MLAPDLRAVQADAGQIEQVIMNLAINARDAMPDGGTLTIETARTSADRMCVTDRRATPGRDDAPTCRRICSSRSSPPRRRARAPGLGLSTVYGIVNELMGAVKVDSELGTGTAFTIFLPAAARESKIPEPQVPAKTRSAVVSRATILLVEDEDTVRRFAKLALERHGFRVIEADLPEHALSLAAATAEPIDLMLTDVVMPQFSGPELAARIKKSRPELPVLYMSGYPASTVMKGESLDPRARLLPKPFTTAELLASIEEVIGKG